MSNNACAAVRVTTTDINIMRTGPDLTDAGDGFARLNLNSLSLSATMSAMSQVGHLRAAPPSACLTTAAHHGTRACA